MRSETEIRLRRIERDVRTVAQELKNDARNGDGSADKYLDDIANRLLAIIQK